MKNAPTRNRIVFVTGDKGGVGKSFAARLLLDWYRENKIRVLGFDTDKTNSTFFRFCEAQQGDEVKIEQLDTDRTTEVDRLLEYCEKGQESVCLVDCAARTMDRLLEWMREVDFASVASELDTDVTILFVMGPEKDCVMILKDMVESFGSSVSYVILKNKGRGEDFGIYDASKVRAKLLSDLAAVEIEVPALLSSTVLAIDKGNFGFREATEALTLGIADRSRARSFRTRAFASFETARGELGC